MAMALKTKMISGGTLGIGGVLCMAGALMATGVNPASAGRPSNHLANRLASHQVYPLASASSPAALLARSEAALAKESVFTLTGSIEEGSARLGLHVESAGRGSTTDSTLTSSSNSIGFVGMIQVITKAGLSYLKGSAPFWSSALGSQGTPKLVSALADKWIQFPQAQAAELTKGFASLEDPGALAKGVLGSNSSKFAEGSPTTVHGTPVVPLISSGSGGGTLYVASHGAPLPIELVGTASQRGLLVFGYPTSLSITAPAGALTEAQIAASLAASSSGTSSSG